MDYNINQLFKSWHKNIWTETNPASKSWQCRQPAEQCVLCWPASAVSASGGKDIAKQSKEQTVSAALILMILTVKTNFSVVCLSIWTNFIIYLTHLHGWTQREQRTWLLLMIIGCQEIHQRDSSSVLSVVYTINACYKICCSKRKQSDLNMIITTIHGYLCDIPSLYKPLMSFILLYYGKFNYTIKMPLNIWTALTN